VSDLNKSDKENAMRGIVLFAAGLLVGGIVQTAIGQSQNRGLVGVNHVGITVPDMDAALDYYTNTLGFKEAFRSLDDEGKPRLIYTQVSQNTFIELNRADGRPAGINHVGIHVEDVEAVANMFRAAGAEVAEVRNSPTGAILSNVMDLNGVRIELAELPPESDHRKAMNRWR
jgi:catechol 2,3-dioxygenase-like lactoylglutathione lyase family enzyme